MPLKGVIVFFILLPCHLFGMDDQQFLFDHLNTSHGLSSDNVFSVIQDAYGFIWVATSDGLNKYDGYNFSHYRYRQDDSTSLINHVLNSRNALYLDSKKRLWICTSNGISRYLPETDNFKNYIPDSAKVNELGYNAITGICEDSDGSFYFSTNWGLIFLYREKEDKLKLLHQKRFGSNITDILLHNNNLWVASGSAGLFRYNLETHGIKHFNPVVLSKSGTNVSINYLYLKDDQIYLLTSQNGILSFDLKSERFNQLEFKDLGSPLVIKDINGDLWVGAKDGIYIRTKKGEIIKIGTRSTNPYGLHSDAKTIFKDDQGNIWIGGTMGGLNILKNSYGFKRYIPNENSNLNLTTEKVSSLYYDAHGKLWVGYFSGEIDRFSIESNTSYPSYQKEKIGDSGGRGTIFKFYKDIKGQLWVCTSNGGLKRYNSEKGHFIPFNLRVNKSGKKLSARDIRSVCQDPDGHFWIVLHGDGLCKYDITKDTQLYFFSDSGELEKSISNIYGFDVIYDGKGYIWFSTSYGLNRIDYRSQQVKHYFYDEHNTSGIAGNYTSSMFVDSQSRLWIATNRGLSVYNREKDKFLNINQKNGFLYTDIRGITEDSKGDIWAISRMNISRIKVPQTAGTLCSDDIRVENYELSAFSGYNEFFTGALIYNNTGKIYIGGSKGIFTFNVHHALNKSINIPIYITAIQVFNESIPIHNSGLPGSLKKHVSLLDTVILRHNQNMLTFEFVGLHYSSPGNIEYSYMLEGLENKWHITSDISKVTYGNLKPQQYTFRIRASVLNQKQERNSKSLAVIIKTPFWQKVWFKGLAILSVVLIVYLLFIIRINLLKKQKQKLEEKVTRRTTELKKTNDLLSEKNNEIIRQKDEIERIALELHEADQMKIRFFMNISHEFRTPLTLILGPLEQLKESLNITHKNLTSFHLIERNAKRLVRLVNQLLDLRKLETNTMKLKVSKGNIRTFIYDVYNHFEYMAKRYSIDYRFEAPPNDYTCFFDKDIIEKVLYNLLSNAFKYVNDHGNICISLEKIDQNKWLKGEIPVNDMLSGEYVKINIRDNGLGIDKEKIPFIFDRFYQVDHGIMKQQKGTGIGLSLTKELVQLHKGQIKVQSRKNEGTLFSIILPVSRNYFETNEITCEATGDHDKEKYPLITHDMPSSRLQEVFIHEMKDTLILVVDDNYDIREYLKTCLTEQFKIIEAENGKTGYQKAKRFMPDLIIADVMMPVVDGYALSKKIKKDITLNHIPLILLTAKSGKENELTGLNTGADDYITKPFHKEVLLARITTILKNRKLIRDKIKRDLTDSENTVLSFEEKFLERVNAVCEERMENSDFSVEQLCEILNMSQSQLYRKIKSLTDYSPFEFIRILRLKRAARLIRYDSDSISQIAYTVGFTDPKYFSKCFKKFFGRSPRTYKNNQ